MFSNFAGSRLTMAPPPLAQVHAGPSGQNKKFKKAKKNQKNVVKSSKVKKLSEKQKIDALERDVADFVSTNSERLWTAIDVP